MTVGAMTGTLSPRRLALAHAAIAIIIGGSGYCILADKEYWPFSHYPMYSTLTLPGPVSALQLAGVTPDGREVPLRADWALTPFVWKRLKLALDRISQRPDARILLPQALHDLRMRYEDRRMAGQHIGEPLAGLRLYRLSWRHVDTRQPLDSRARQHRPT
jgi:hypothetical protein